MEQNELEQMDVLLLTNWVRYRAEALGVDCATRRGREALIFLAMCCSRGPGQVRRCLHACAETAGLWYLPYNSMITAALKPLAKADPEMLAYFGLYIQEGGALEVGKAFARAYNGEAPRKLEAAGRVYK